jgi:hypothetical protein
MDGDLARHQGVDRTITLARELPVNLIQCYAVQFRMRRDPSMMEQFVQNVMRSFKILTVKKIGIHPVDDGNANNSGGQNFHVLPPAIM